MDVGKDRLILKQYKPGHYTDQNRDEWTDAEEGEKCQVCAEPAIIVGHATGEVFCSECLQREYDITW